MDEDLILLIGAQIKQIRQQKNITLDKLALKAGVSKGLISQIENNRTIPSLPVLFSIIHSLNETVNDFFSNLQQTIKTANAIVIRKNETVAFQKEPVKGFSYHRILTKTILAQAIDFVVLELEAGAKRRKFIQTDAYECKYFMEGNIEYQIEDEIYQLSAGDTLFFDGRLRHRLTNTGKSKARILVIYFF